MVREHPRPPNHSSNAGSTHPLSPLAHTTTTRHTALPKATAIVGAGPAGLFASLVLARRGYTNITVFDRLPRPPEPSSAEWGNPLRSYNLGLGARGQIALTEAEVRICLIDTHPLHHPSFPCL